ncbi:hypothetical protein RUMCAL_03098 [Ruminococcus callidus ATCC 27760]|uniref:Uncharacterized protein n=1 Tax=Ruminococcus callidus ATCC 27760 TaxID=411473 RepID=U2LNF3_9FIRM|nr:hypothetical protein RUMCAL_03098 [Ruminococcus callidus ATCC 27760]
MPFFEKSAILKEMKATPHKACAVLPEAIPERSVMLCGES